MKNLFSKGKISILIMVLILGSSIMFLTSSLSATEDSIQSLDHCHEFCRRYADYTDMEGISKVFIFFCIKGRD